MDHAAFLRLIRGQTRGPLATLGRWGLGAASLGYGLGVAWRNLAFDRNPGRSIRALVPVVAVGNLTVGGTGKTPMVEWICRHYRQRAIRVAILSRGYGSTGGLNDEGLVLFDNLPDVPHLQAPDRVELARIAVEELESQLLVLDDGFQHRRLARDLDVVLLDALDPFGGGRLLPRGLLREPVSSLSRAGVIVLSRADQVDQATRDAIRREVVRRLGREAAWVEARHAPRDLIDERVESAPMADLVGRSILAFCGIGNPHAFARTLSDAGANVIDFVEFADHHDYRREDVEGLIARVEHSGADLALTTQKDLVKLRIGSLGRAPLRALRIGLEILDGSEGLTAALDRVIPEAQNSAT